MPGVFQAPIFVSPLQPATVPVEVVEAFLAHLIVTLQAVNRGATI
jgi:hypothetical protein